ncbi:MAG: mucoidy inhibitor MuiA family protein [Planctomycetota bacterium]|jgi:hypothetical protein
MTATTLSSRIESVIVYREGARVTRSAEVEASADGFPGEIRVPNLPLSLDDDSLRLRLEALAEADTTALPDAADLRVGLDVPPPDGTLPPPKDEELEEARLEVQRLEQEEDRLERSLERFEGLTIDERPKGKRGQQPPSSPTDARLALLEFRRRELERVHGELREVRKSSLRAQEKLDELEVRHALASSARAAREHELRKAAVARLRPPEGASLASRARVVVEYMVPGARWAPSYAVRFDAGTTRARLQFRALVGQRSGEDWKGVNLSLSTADAMRWTELPELPSLKIGRRQPTPPRPGWREPPTGAEALYGDYDRVQSAAPQAEFKAPEPELRRDVLREDTGVYDRLEDDLDDEGAWGAAEEMECVEEPPPEAQMIAASSVMPPPPPAAPPAPRAKPAKKMKEMAKRRSAAPDMSMAVGGGAMAKADDAFYPPSDEPVSGGDLTAPSDLLRYGRLRLPGPREGGRGKLRPVSEAERTRDLLRDLAVAGGDEVVGWIHSAAHRASQVSSSPLPSGHATPGSVEGFDYRYGARRPVDVPSDGAYHTLPILEENADAKRRFVTVPREAVEVFRFVTFRNPLESPLLRGPADIYVGGDFALTSPLETVAPSGEVEIGLGAEEAIKVARNTRFEEHASGILGGHLNLENEIRVEITNHLEEAAELEIRERVSAVREGDEEVEVEVLDSQPPWEVWKQKRSPIPGSHRWRVHLEAGASQTLTARYAIRLSSKKQLRGGNRRES